jgi:hypothetical protein
MELVADRERVKVAIKELIDVVDKCRKRLIHKVVDVNSEKWKEHDLFLKHVERAVIELTSDPVISIQWREQWQEQWRECH